MSVAIKKIAKKVPPKQKIKAVEATVQVIQADGSENTEHEQIGDVNVTEPYATVSFQQGLTKNLGNYESLKFSVTLSIPCAINGEDIEQTFEQAKSWVDGKINDIMNEVNQSLGEG